MRGATGGRLTEAAVRRERPPGRREDHAVPAALLGPAERRVGPAEDRLSRVPDLGDRPAHGDHDPEIPFAGQDARPLDQHSEPIGDLAQGGLIHAGDREDELLAAEPRDGVPGPGGFEQGSGDGSRHRHTDGR